MVLMTLRRASGVNSAGSPLQGRQYHIRTTQLVESLAKPHEDLRLTVRRRPNFLHMFLASFDLTSEGS